MEKLITVANGSASSLYGCISTAVQELIKNKFPINYFKYTAVSTELATRNIRRVFGSNTSTEIVKREKPYLLVQPTFSTMGLMDPLQNIPLTANFDNIHHCVDKRYLFEVIKDTKYGYNLKFKMNRDRIEFDVTVTTSTLHQQLDIHRTMLNQIMWETPGSHRVALESVIPRSIVGVIGKLCEMDIDSNPEYIPILTKRMNECSGYPITYKMRNASYSDEWYMYYTHNIIISFTDLAMDAGSRKNMSPDDFNITFKVIAEFNLPGLYLVDSQKPDIPTDLYIWAISRTENDSNPSYIQLHTATNIYSRYPQELDGMQLYGCTIFNTTAEKHQIYDEIEFGAVLESEYIKAIQAHKNFYNNTETLIKIIIIKNKEELKYDEDYTINWNNLTIRIKDPDNSVTYRLIIYFNLSMINELLSNTNYNRNYDISKLTENKLESSVPQNRVIIKDSDINSSQLEVSETMFLKGSVPPEFESNEGIIIIEPIEELVEDKESVQSEPVSNFKYSSTVTSENVGKNEEKSDSKPRFSSSR